MTKRAQRDITVEHTDTNETHVYETGKSHVALPTCFCNPHLSLASQDVWCHFSHKSFLKIVLDIKP